MKSETRRDGHRASFDPPGKDIDPDGSIERHVKLMWCLVGTGFSSGLLLLVLKQFGWSIFPSNPQFFVDYLPTIAFSLSCLNILCWGWFPLEDLAILRRWVRTRKAMFPAHTSECFSMLLATGLLLLLTSTSLKGAIWFNLTGTGVYLWNFIGFSLIRKKVGEGISEARKVFAKGPSERTIILWKILDVVEEHWSSSPSKHWLLNRQQIRHASLTLLFLVAAVLAILGHTPSGSSPLEHWSYGIGVFVIISAEVSIAIWRTTRDAAIVNLHGQLRDFEAQVDSQGEPNELPKTSDTQLDSTESGTL